MPAPTLHIPDLTNRANPASADYVGDAPTNIASGDLLVAHIRASTGNFTITGYPTGWTEEDSQISGGAANTSVVATKMGTGGEPASYTFVSSVSTVASGVTIFRISGVHPTAYIDAVIGSFNSTSAATQTVPGFDTNTSGPDRLIIRFITHNPNVTSTWPTSTEFNDFSLSPTAPRSMSHAYAVQASAGDPGGEIVTTSANAAAAMHTLAVAPPDEEELIPGDPDQLVTARAIWTAA